MFKKVAIQDLMDTFNCDEKQARQIKGLIKNMAVEAFDEEIEREERKGMQLDDDFEVPF